MDSRCPQNDIVEQMDPGSVNNIGFVVIIARVNCSLLHNSLSCQMETIYYNNASCHRDKVCQEAPPLVN